MRWSNDSLFVLLLIRRLQANLQKSSGMSTQAQINYLLQEYGTRANMFSRGNAAGRHGRAKKKSHDNFRWGLKPDDLRRLYMPAIPFRAVMDGISVATM